MRLCLTLLPLFLAISVSHAQELTILPGDPEVFGAFLRMHHAMVTTAGDSGGSLQSPSGLSEGRPPALGWRKELGIDDTDFAKIEMAYLNLSKRLAALQDETKRYASAHPAQAEPTALKAFHNRRLAMLKSAAANLRNQLSPSGAAALFGFIDGRFRASVKRTPIKNVN